MAIDQQGLEPTIGDGVLDNETRQPHDSEPRQSHFSQDVGIVAGDRRFNSYRYNLAVDLDRPFRKTRESRDGQAGVILEIGGRLWFAVALEIGRTGCNDPP
jgi:hypothetical protein